MLNEKPLEPDKYKIASSQSTQVQSTEGIYTDGYTEEDESTTEGDQLSPVLRWWVLPITATLVLIFGTANLLLLQFMRRQDVYVSKSCVHESCPMTKFNANFFAQFINSAAQVMCLGLFYLDKFFAHISGRGSGWLEYEARSCQTTPNKPTPRCIVWAIPALLDFLASILVLYALSIEQASTVQVLRTFAVVFCAIMSVTYLQRDLKIFQWCGVGVLTVGLLITCWDSVFSDVQPSEKPSGHLLRWLGWGAVLLSTLVNTFQLVFEERVTSRFRCSPFKAVGWIGTFELVIVTIAMVIAHIAHVERIDITWWQAATTPNLRWASIAICVSVAGFMALGLAITKMAGAMLTAALSALRQVPIWAMELLLGWFLFDPVAFVGMLITVVGFLIYNGMFASCFDLNHTVRIRCTCIEVSDDEEYVPEESTTSGSTSAHEETLIVVVRSEEFVVESKCQQTT